MNPSAAPTDRRQSRGKPAGRRHRRLRVVRAGVLASVFLSLSLALCWAVSPPLSHYRAVLEQGLADYLHAPVRIRDFDLTWQGLGPALRLRDFSLLDPAGRLPLAGFDQALIGLDLPRSLISRHLIFSNIHLAGGGLILENRPDCGYSVSACTPNAAPTPLPDVVSWLFNIQALNLAFDQVELRSGAVAPVLLHDVQLRLRPEDGKRRLELAANLPAALGRRLEATIQLDGAVSEPESWRVTFYADAADLNLAVISALCEARCAPLAFALRPSHSALSGRADATVWGEWRTQRLQSVLGKLTLRELEGVEFGQDQDASNLLTNLPQLDTDFNWWLAAEGWRWHSHTVGLTARGAPAINATVELALAPASPDGWRQLYGECQDLRLQDLAALAAPWLAEEPRHTLLALAPTAAVPELSFRLALADQEGDVSIPAVNLQTLTARFHDLTVRSWRQRPGVRGLNGAVSVTGNTGELVAEGQGVRVEAAELLRYPAVFKQLSGSVTWRHDAAGWEVASSGLSIGNSDFHARLKGKITGSADRSSPFVDLQVDYGDLDISRAHRYLPAGVMKPRLVAWLDQTLVSGRATTGSLVYRGHTGDFPFDKGQGLFETRFQLNDAILDYRPPWPRIEELEAEVIFRNRSFSVEGVSGKILDADLERVQARIDNLTKATLEIQSHIQAPAPTLLRILRDSPVAARTSGYVAGMAATGDNTLDLALTIPLDKRPVSVSGAVGFAEGDLSLPEWNVNLDNLNGKLYFTESGVKAKDLQLVFRGQPARLDIDDSDPHTEVTRLRLRARFTPGELLGRYGTALESYLAGRGNWDIELLVPPVQTGKPRQFELSLASDLQGVEVKLPSPLGKAAGAKRDFRAGARLGGTGPLTLRLDYQPDTRALLELTGYPGDTRLNRGEVRIGAGEPQLPKTSGLAITAKLQRFEPDLPAPSAGAAGAIPSWLNTLQAQIDELLIGGQRFRAVTIDAQRNNRGLTAEVSGETLAGRLQWPATATPQDPVQMTLQHLDINWSGQTPLAQQNSQGRQDVDPGALPPLAITVAKLRLNGEDLGRLKLSTLPQPGGLRLDNLELSSAVQQLTATGDWRRTPAGQASTLQARLSSRSLSQTLQGFGFNPDLEGGETEADLQADWPGSLLNFSPPLLNGRLNLRIGQGQLTQLEPGGVGRLFGLINLSTLTRRLTLDFRDLFDKGLSFDRIQGDFAFAKGQAHTDNLLLESPSAHILITGRTNLVDRQYDQIITVTPQVSSSLPIAGAIVGGPVVGAAVLLAERLLKPGINQINRYQYSVTGSWDNPVIQPLPRAGNDGRTSGFGSK